MLDQRRSLAVACVLGLFSMVTAAAQIRPVSIDSEPNLFVWTDTCNVYVLKDGDAALLIDLGDGSVLDHLAEIGVKRVEWVLFTHHHREQCQGFARLQEWKPQIAGPEAERALFEEPTKFRRDQAHSRRCVHRARRQLRAAANRADPSGPHVQGWGHFLLEGPAIPLRGHAGQQSGRHVLPAESRRSLDRLQRRCDARRRPDAHVVRHGMGLRLRQGTLRADRAPSACSRASGPLAFCPRMARSSLRPRRSCRNTSASSAGWPSCTCGAMRSTHLAPPIRTPSRHRRPSRTSGRSRSICTSSRRGTSGRTSASSSRTAAMPSFSIAA